MYSPSYGPAFRLCDPFAEMMWTQHPAAPFFGGGNPERCSCASCSRSRAVERSRRRTPCWRASAYASPFAAPHITYPPAAARVHLHPLCDHDDEDDTYDLADDASDDDYCQHSLFGRACQHQHQPPLQRCMHASPQRPAAAHPAHCSRGGCIPAAAAAAKAQRQPMASAWAATPATAACSPPTHIDQHQRRQRQRQQQAHGPWCSRPIIPVQVMVGGDDQHPQHPAAPVPVRRRQSQQPATPAAEPRPAAPQPAAPQPAPRRLLTRTEAATAIQASWRMQRLARQRPALTALATAAAGLRSAHAKFDSLKLPEQAASSSSQWQLSHQQYLELNEQAMRVLLQLDATSCGVPELRAIKRRLSSDTISLLDSIQAAYSCTVRASMELPNDVVQEAVAAVARTAAAAAQDDSSSSSQAAAQAGRGQQQQAQQAQTLDQPEPAGAQQTAVRVVLVCAGSSCDAATQTDD